MLFDLNTVNSVQSQPFMFHLKRTVPRTRHVECFYGTRFYGDVSEKPHESVKTVKPYLRGFSSKLFVFTFPVFPLNCESFADVVMQIPRCGVNQSLLLLKGNTSIGSLGSHIVCTSVSVNQPPSVKQL